MKKTLLLILIAISTTLSAQEVTKNQVGQIVHYNGIQLESSIPSTNFRSDNETLWQQDVSQAQTKYGIGSCLYNLAEWGMFCADDFELEESSAINAILFYGSQYASDGADYINGVDIYFYEDDNGIPAGHPLLEDSAYRTIKGIPYEHFVVEPGVDAFLGNKIYHIDLEAIDMQVILPEGVYWISIVFDLELDEIDFDIRWNWSDSEADNLNPPKLIAPAEHGVLVYPEWTDISEIGFPMTSLAFSLYGEKGVVSANWKKIQELNIYPNPASEYLIVDGYGHERLLNVSAYNMIGQHFDLHIQNGKIDISMLTPGLYVLQVKTDSNTLNGRFVVK